MDALLPLMQRKQLLSLLNIVAIRSEATSPSFWTTKLLGKKH